MQAKLNSPLTSISFYSAIFFPSKTLHQLNETKLFNKIMLLFGKENIFAFFWKSVSKFGWKNLRQYSLYVNKQQ